MKKAISILINILFLSLNLTPIFASEPGALFYTADIAEGVIGGTPSNPTDSPTDNVFIVLLNEQPAADDEIWLNYELYGVSDHTGISRSINDQLAVGGQLVNKNTNWSQQTEQLNPQWLKQGENIIRFTLPKKVAYQYKIKNLGLQIKKMGNNNRAIVINQPSTQKAVNNYGYIKGFVKGKGSQNAQLFINNVPQRTLSSEFESLKFNEQGIKNWTVSLKAVFADGEVIEENVNFIDSEDAANFINEMPLAAAAYAASEYLPAESFTVGLRHAEISIEPASLLEPTPISITALRKVDIPPMDMGMINVTKNSEAYRFLPHGTNFTKTAKVKLAYDESKIPDGYSTKDIRTYYFDEGSKHWVALPLDTVLSNQNTIISKTTHFTDMINGIIKAPESPETGAYMPTSIKDIKAADPSANINTIEPPGANNLGTANMGYPIVIPPGRQGMQPMLGIQYNSGGGNNWLGLGWNLSIPSVMIDTRWGVPRYDTNLETETYSLNGAQLAPVAHRNEFENRTAEKQFHPRVEGSFDLIIRRGDNPKNYWWEVTDKSGTIYSYGGTEKDGVVESSVLKDDEGNIAHWALVEIRDLNDNFVHYQCTVVNHNGGRNIYINRITYTGHGSTEGKYEVLFTRDSELGEPLRKDVTVNCVYGFKKVTADLLKKIEINFNNQRVRSYELAYSEGAFYKTLLQKISEFDAVDSLFTEHEFDYFDDVKAGDGYKPFEATENWMPQNDGITGEIETADFPEFGVQFEDKASVLGASKSNGSGFSTSMTSGQTDAGSNIGFDSSTNEGLMALVDINGDGLPDKVFKTEDGLVFRPNKSGPQGTNTFGDTIQIKGINNFSKGKSKTNYFGLESNAESFAGYQNSKTTNTTSTYFSDVNGDRLIDIVDNCIVYFNRIDEEGRPIFNKSSTETPSPIDVNASIDEDLASIDDNAIDDEIKQNPLHNVIRVWIAPYDGNINISGEVKLIEPEQKSGTADGVRVAIQHKTIELWDQKIEVDDTLSYRPAGVENISVAVGDRVYFRVQSVFDGTDDQVNWSPTITYLDREEDAMDANGLSVYQFNAADDFLLTAANPLGMPLNGRVKIESTFKKPLTSDDVTVEITKKETVLFTKTYLAGEAIDEAINWEGTVSSDDKDFLQFRLKANTTVDWTSIEWTPKVFYVSSDNPGIDLLDANGNPTLNFYPSLGHTIFNQTVQPAEKWTAEQDGNFNINPQIVLNSIFIPNENGELTFSIKRLNESFAISSTFSNVIIMSDSISTVAPTGIFTTTNDDAFFGSGYRNWGQFAYNGNEERASMPINEAKLDSFIMAGTGMQDSIPSIDLNLPDISLDENSTIEDAQAVAAQMDSIYQSLGGARLTDANFVMLTAVPNEGLYRGCDNLTYVSDDIISASRLGEDDISSISPVADTDVEVATDGASAIKLIKEITNYNLSLAPGDSGKLSYGTTTNLYDYIDMNGDNHPDIVTENKIQFTLPTGGLEEQARAVDFGKIQQAKHSSFGVSGGGTFLNSGAKNSNSNGENASHEEVGAKNSVGLNGTRNFNKDEVDYALMDINADGLPDKVYADGEVKLNLGYKFTNKEPWNYEAINKGNSTTTSVGPSININNGSIAAGISLSKSENEVDNTLQDMNGDGLLDYVELANPLKVSINTGYGFAEPIDWTDADAINKSSSIGESENNANTNTNGQTNANTSNNKSRGLSEENVQIRDINGDGYPDYLIADKDNALQVKLSTIRRTNLLKGVKRPLGATFTMDYKRIGNTYEQPMDVWALAKVELYDGFEGDGADEIQNTFEYEAGFYDRHERDFYGFKTIKSHQRDTENNNALYRTVVQEFMNENYYEFGFSTREVLQDANGNLYTENLSEYEFLDIETGLSVIDEIKESDDASIFTTQVSSEQFFYEGEAEYKKRAYMTYEYDVFGNVTNMEDVGDIESEDDIYSTITYHQVPDKYIMNAPDSIIVQSRIDGTIYRKRKAEIDFNNGNVTKVSSFLENGESANYDMAYDIYGNLEKLERPWNKKGERLTYEYEYDTEVHTYNTKVSDSYGYNSSSTYDYRFGQMCTSTDLNNNPMRYEIDDAGRITSITGPFELAADSIPYTIDFEYHPDTLVPYALTKHYDPQHPDNNIETYTFIDGLRRVLQVKKDEAIFTEPWKEDEEKMIVSGRLGFDAFGRTKTSHYPVTEPLGIQSTFNFTFDTIAPTRTTFDVLDRALTVTLPDLATTTYQYGFGVDRKGKIQFSTKTTDANGIWKENFTNVRGLQTAFNEQHSQGTNIWTSFDYNPINELVKVTDDQDNETTYRYDWFGRKTNRVHPDAGKTSYKYDLASNLTKKITANLKELDKAIKYKYEFERLTNIKYPVNTYNDVTYKYGDAGAKANRAGRLVKQSDATGEQKFSYDALGNITKNVRTIHVPDCETLEFTTKWTYDTWNRLTEMVYPDKEKVRYTYNVGGLLNSINGVKKKTDYPYVKQLAYDKFEQRVYLHYGNGTDTRYTYEPDRRRLETMKVETPGHRKFIDYEYDYDKVSNITRFQNHAGVEKESHLLGGQTEYTYDYDDLYRLTEAKGKHKGSKGEDQYELTMQYNNLHSIVNKEQLHERKINTASVFVKKKKTSHSLAYDYDKKKQPHAPIQVGKKSYTYDANGNQLGWDHDKKDDFRRILWDEENRIKAINDNGAVFKYLYDAGGERVLKNTGSNQTVSLNGVPHEGYGADDWSQHWHNGSDWYQHWHGSHYNHSHHHDGHHEHEHYHEHGHEHTAHDCLKNITIYVNPFVVIRNREVTKHFYMGSERVVTKLADPYDQLFQNEGGPIDDLHNEEHGIEPAIETNVYYYHPDHLGNTGYVTQLFGEVSQHVEYFAFGETFLEERNNTADRTPYLFNAKELDEETGLYYYGARYYDPVVSNWLSVDPMADNYLGWSPYNYTLNNPIVFLDPDGRTAVRNSETDEIVMIDDGHHMTFTVSPETFEKIKNNTDGKTMPFFKMSFRDNLRWQASATGAILTQSSEESLILKLGGAGEIGKALEEASDGNYKRGGFIIGTSIVLSRIKWIRNLRRGNNGTSSTANRARVASGTNLTKTQLKSIASLQKQINIHRIKLREFKVNPYRFDNKGFLQNAPNNAIRERIIQGRIRHLEREINTFQKNIEKIINGQ